MNISFTSTKTTQSFFLNVKSNAVSLVVDEITVYTFDRAGRLVTAVIDDRPYRRDLDNRVLCKWREPKVASWAGRRRWLSETESRQVIDHAPMNAMATKSFDCSPRLRWVSVVYG